MEFPPAVAEAAPDSQPFARIASAPSPRGREFWGVGLLLLICLCLFFCKALVTGRALCPADLVFASSLFREKSPAGFTHPSNDLLFDQVYQFIPWRHFARESLRQGHLPLWNPDSLSGTPLVATMQSAVFYPVNWITALLPLPQTFLWSAVLRLWIAGFGTYLLSRRYALGRTASLIAAFSYMFCGFLIVWLGHPHTNVLIWLPALILLAENLLTDPARRLRWAALLALTVGVQFLGGHIESSVDIMTTTALYAVLRWLQETGAQRRLTPRAAAPLGVLLGAIALGTLLAAVQLAPFLEWLPLSSPFHRRAPTGFHWIDPAFWRHLVTLPLLVFPNLYGNPSWDYPRDSLIRDILRYGNYNETALYIGILPLLLAVVAAARCRHLPAVRAWMMIGTLSLGRALHLPLFDWLNQLPGLSLESAGRLRLIFSFSLCVLAGFGAQSLWEASQREGRPTTGLWLRLCGAVAGLGLLLALFGRAGLPALMRHAHAGSHRLGLLSEFQTTLSLRDPLFYAPALFALAGLAAVWGLRARPGRLPLLKALLAALTFLDLFAFGHGYNPTVPVQSFYPVTAAVTQLQADTGLSRVTALGTALYPDAQMMFGLADVRGMDFMTQWYDEYMALDPGHMTINSYSEMLSSADSPLVRVLNVKYVVSNRAAALPPPGLTDSVRQHGNVFVAQMAHVQPRSFLVSESVTATDDAQAAQWLRAAPDAVFHRVVLSTDAQTGAPPALPASDAAVGPADQVSLLHYGPAEAAWRVTAGGSRYLVTSDAYYPGWAAFLDGARVPVYRANLAFRAVSVPGGVHTVVYRYEPLSVRVGMTISVLSLLAVLLLFARARTRRLEE